MKHTITVQQGQTLADVAVQEYGTVEVMADIAILNNLPAHHMAEPGTLLRLPDINPAPGMAQRVKAQGIQPASRTNRDEFRVFSSVFDTTFA